MEADFVGVDNLQPGFLWIHCFVEAQGLKIKNLIMYQDKPSAIKTGSSSGPSLRSSFQNKSQTENSELVVKRFTDNYIWFTFSLKYILSMLRDTGKEQN